MKHHQEWEGFEKERENCLKFLLEEREKKLKIEKKDDGKMRRSGENFTKVGRCHHRRVPHLVRYVVDVVAVVVDDFFRFRNV